MWLAGGQARFDEILAHVPSAPTLFQMADSSRIFVLDFPELASQGAAMNRLAALVEKAGLPRDRLLDDTELAFAIALAGDTASTYYYGHNYRVAHLQRLFELADRDGIRLNEREEMLREILATMLREVPDGVAALLTLTADPDAGGPSARRAILRHEVSHGWFFTRPDYAAGVMEAWTTDFSEAEREAFRAWLAAQGYDPGQEDLVVNEMQAYLLHTDDPNFFRPEVVGLTAAEAERLSRIVQKRIDAAVARGAEAPR